ncbi:antibiotic biosynthesis monooxygenase family protein [Streptomyces sp. NPDC001315]|uniref:antibiotic biosynthesis monooxygenase family protein n=1 Tax=Streptomyces sp. NPDC001315 TaxID=3364562 RepID=UPI0036773DBF
MAFISPEDGYLAVFNLFDTKDAADQERLLEAMKEIINTADYDGWVASTVHGAVGRPGTANYVQWRSREQLEARYRGQKFQQKTVPQFASIATSTNLVPTEVVYSQRHPSLDAVEISPDRDDYTVIIVMQVAPENQDRLIELMSYPDEWVKTVPGYRSHSIHRGVDGTYVINYAQWESQEQYEAFHNLPEHERPVDIQKVRAEARPLVTSRVSNGYRVAHSRSAGQ